MYGPHVCPIHGADLTSREFYGRYVHRAETEPATCPNHKGEIVILVPGTGAKVDESPREVCQRQPIPGYVDQAEGWCQGHAAT